MLAPCRCLDGHVKEPYEMSLALGARLYVQLLLQSACTSMCRHLYDWIIVYCGVKQPLHLTSRILRTVCHTRSWLSCVSELSILLHIAVPCMMSEYNSCFLYYHIIIQYCNHMQPFVLESYMTQEHKDPVQYCVVRWRLVRQTNHIFKCLTKTDDFHENW